MLAYWQLLCECVCAWHVWPLSSCSELLTPGLSKTLDACLSTHNTPPPPPPSFPRPISSLSVLMYLLCLPPLSYFFSVSSCEVRHYICCSNPANDGENNKMKYLQPSSIQLNNRCLIIFLPKSIISFSISVLTLTFFLPISCLVYFSLLCSPGAISDV